MGTRDPRIDAYIAKSGEFARPILAHLRDIVHDACPDVKEDLKWSSPHFMYKGMMCGMAAFKEHCAFGFWKAKLVFDGKAAPIDGAMGQFGCITTIKDLPSRRVIAGYVKKAMKLNEEGAKVARPLKHPKSPLKVPADLATALKKSKKAATTFAAFSPSYKREYVEWITAAKGADTRKRRLDQAVEWMAEGKSRNWKYQNC